MTIEKADWLFESDGFYLKFKVKNREEGQRIVAEVKSSDKPYELTVEKKKRKRSLDANAYCWVLIGKLAAKLHLSMIDIYRDAIKTSGITLRPSACRIRRSTSSATGGSATGSDG